jgi:probable HAF family extracellular repeat protein
VSWLGTYFAEDTGYHGFIRDGGTVTTIDPPGAIATSVNGINDAGTVVGHYLVAGGEDGVEHGFVYQDGQFLRSTTQAPPAVLCSTSTTRALRSAAMPPRHHLRTFFIRQGSFSAVPVCAPQTNLVTISNQGDLIGSMPSGINTTVGIVASNLGLLVVQPPGASLSVLAAGNA